MAEGEKWTGQPVADGFESGDIMSIVRGGDNEQLDFDLLKEALMPRFNTGWIANSDWTNATLTITHNLNANLSELIVKLFISTDGTEANSFEMDFASIESSSTNNGIAKYQTSVNEINIYTGTSGARYVLDTGGLGLLDTDSFYYKVVVYKL